MPELLWCYSFRGFFFRIKYIIVKIIIALRISINSFCARFDNKYIIVKLDRMGTILPPGILNSFFVSLFPFLSLLQIMTHLNKSVKQ